MNLILVPKGCLDRIQDSVPDAKHPYVGVICSPDPIDKLKRWWGKNKKSPAWIELRRALRHPIDLPTGGVSQIGPTERPITILSLPPSPPLDALREKAERVLFEAGISWFAPLPSYLVLGRGKLRVAQPFLSTIRMSRLVWKG